MKLVATTMAGLEPILAEELKKLGGTNVLTGKRSVEFEGDLETMYKANLLCRTALRILKPIKSFRAFNENQLYNKVYKFNWSLYLDNDMTFAIDAVTHSNLFKHSQYAGLKVKDAIVDQFRKHTGSRPSVDTNRPQVKINVHITDDRCTLSLDSSGDSLHKRGYRIKTGLAPLSEVLAAGLILQTGWKYDCPFLDPMCGSGTLAIEAAMMAYNIPAQQNRRYFGFDHWKDTDRDLWKKVKAEAKEATRTFDFPIMGSDKDMRSVKMSESNAVGAGFSPDQISFSKKSFEKLDSPDQPCLIVTNPPYDERLQSDDIDALYASIGDQLKQKYQGSTAWVISSNRKALRSIRLRPFEKYRFFNGPLDCAFYKYEMYDGSRPKE